MRSIVIFLSFIFAIYVNHISYLSAEEVSEKTVLATVNGENITIGNVISFRSRLSEEYQSIEDNVLFDGILKQLIQQIILSQNVNSNSRKIKYALENQTRAFLSQELLGNLSEVEIVESEIKSLYEDFLVGVKEQKEFNASHILVETEGEAKKILESLKNGIDFSELAKKHSTGPSGAKGGALGWFGEGAMVPEFENAVTKLSVDEVSLPVVTQFGWHIIKLNEIRIIPIPGIEEIREDLITEIKKKKIEIEMNKLIDAADVVFTDLEFDSRIIREDSLLHD
jgi:peptidyl-prolyl cis-trans isomerase C